VKRTFGYDMHPLLLGMIWTFSPGGKLFACQSGVLIVGYSYGNFADPRSGAYGRVPHRRGVPRLLLLVPFYWPLIGLK
jgi:hypothetical protein